MLVLLRLDEQPPVVEIADDLLRSVSCREAVQPAEGGIEVPGLVDGGDHVEVERLGELEILGTAARCDVHDSRAVLHRDVVPGDHTMLDLATRAECVERALVPPADDLGTGEPLHEHLVGIASDGDPVAVLEPTVLRDRVDGGGDVCWKRPRRRRPDDDRLSRSIEKPEPDEERWVDTIDIAAMKLVCGDRRAAARAPLGRTMALEEPAFPVDDREELPDVLDVRVREREVVVAPVHPLAESDRPLGQVGRRLDDDVAAAA